MLSGAWLIAVSGSLCWNLHQHAKELRRLAGQAAQALLEKDLLYREWSLLQGGVYVLSTNRSPPANDGTDEDREIETPGGRHLTLLNPAIVSRQIFELQSRSSGVRAHLTSLRPVRAANAPDDWERQGLQAFAEGRAEVSGIVTEGAESYLRMMRPLVTVPSCLRCHEEAGRKPGEVRGGISVMVPLNASASRSETWHLGLAHLGLWSIGMAGLVLAVRNLNQHSHRRNQAETALHAAKEELVRANAGLEQKVQERTARLEEALADLEHFSYTITHDMRAPLRAMQGMSSILLEECATCLAANQRDYIRRIVDSASRMDRLITDALQYTGVVRGRFGLEPVDSDALLRGILECYPQFQPPHAAIRIEGTLPMVQGNPAAMTQCFSNLLGNAVKFVQPGKVPQVRIWAEFKESGTGNSDFGVAEAAPLRTPHPAFSTQYVRFWFEDQGIGIEKQYQERIWHMFQRLDKRYEGTGIGLALVCKVVERMGGRVGVESEPGQGSRFWVELKPAPGETRSLGTQLFWTLQPAEASTKS